MANRDARGCFHRPLSEIREAGFTFSSVLHEAAGNTPEASFTPQPDFTAEAGRQIPLRPASPNMKSQYEEVSEDSLSRYNGEPSHSEAGAPEEGEQAALRLLMR